MTRRAVYGFGLFLTIVSTIMTVESIIMPRWLSPTGQRRDEYSLGLHKRCNLITGSCHSFPQEYDCRRYGQSFCQTWRTVSFLVSFSVVIELATLVSFTIIMAGGVQRRAAGWKVISSLLLFSALVECIGMGLMAYLFKHDNHFVKGWHLDASWTLSTASWIFLTLAALGIGASALCLPEEGGYEIIPDYQMRLEQDEQLRSRISLWNDGYRSGGYQDDRTSIRSNSIRSSSIMSPRMG